MKFQIINKLQLKKASGLVVVIDVLRAFTTVCYIFSNEAARIILVENEKEGLNLKKQNPSLILIGERKGLKIPNYDYGNSPYELKNVNFLNKTVVMTTSQGTAFFYKLHKLPNCEELITGSFVNASAIVNYIKRSKSKTITLACTDDSYDDNEDYMCAKYLISSLQGKPLNFLKIKKDLMEHPTAEGFIKRPLTKYAPHDFRLCLQLNKFSLIIRARKSNKHIILESIKL